MRSNHRALNVLTATVTVRAKGKVGDQPARKASHTVQLHVLAGQSALLR